MRSAPWFSYAALLCSACAPLARAEWPHLNQKLTAKQVTIRNVVVLPAQVVFDKTGTRGSEGGISEAGQIAETFYAEFCKELGVRGVVVLPNPQAQAKDDTARYAVADVQAKYDNVAVQLRRKPGRVA